MENFFLEYANNSFRERVENLWVINNLTCRDDGAAPQDLDPFIEVTEAIICISKKEYAKASNTGAWVSSLAKDIPYENRGTLINVLKKYHRKPDLHPSITKYGLAVYDMAYQCVYGHRLGKCDSNWRKNTLDVFGEESFNGPKRLKCYECDQLYFIHVLKEITRGREYNEIVNLEYVLWITNDRIVYQGDIDISLKNPDKSSSYKTSLIREMDVRFPLNLREDAKEVFTDFGEFPSYRICLLGGAIYSLFEFLDKNDRRKLKFCDECKKFFISKTIRPSKFCSPKCRLSWHNRIRITSGEHREYKRRKRKEGAKESYYG